MVLILAEEFSRLLTEFALCGKKLLHVQDLQSSLPTHEASCCKVMSIYMFNCCACDERVRNEMATNNRVDLLKLWVEMS